MKKNILSCVLMFVGLAAAMQLYADIDNTMDTKKERADGKQSSQQLNKTLTDLPKKIRISTKPAAPQVKHVASSISEVLDKKIEPPMQAQEVSQPRIAKVESELEQTLLAMQSKASQKPSMKNALDSAIAELATSSVATDHRPIQSTKREQSKNVRRERQRAIEEVPEIIAATAEQTQALNEPQQDITTNLDVAQTFEGASRVVVSDYEEPIASNDYINDVVENEYVQSTPRIINNDLVDQTKLDRKRIYLGRAYNYAVIEEEEEKHFVVPTAIFFSYAFQGFDDCKRTVPLASVLLNGKSFTVGDIFLEARLSAEVVQWPADTDNDASKLFLEPNGPGNVTTQNGQTAQFGNRRRQQYLGLLAPVEVNFSTNYYQMVAQTGFIYRFYLTEEERIAFSAGIIFPIVSKFQDTEVNLQKGKLFDRTEFSAKDATYREFSIGRFYNDFSSLEDFFLRAVLEPKGLALVPKQQAFGIGDVSLFGLFDFAPMLCHMDGMQIGVNLSLPTSNKALGNTIFEVELDEGGATSFDIFANCIFNSGNKYVNPSLYLSGNFSVPFTASMRVPTLVSHVATFTTSATNGGEGYAVDANRVTNIPGLIAPVMREFFALSFSEYDSLIPGFSDSPSIMRLSRGPKFIIGMGNYFYDVFNCNFRFGLFYDFTAKGGDTVCPTDCSPTPKIFDTSGYQCIKSFAHRIGVNLTYKFACGELNAGAQWIVAGRNTAKVNDAFASFIAVF